MVWGSCGFTVTVGVGFGHEGFQLRLCEPFP